jgi:protein-disulfide isomerase/uncharacterized membrane protein
MNKKKWPLYLIAVLALVGLIFTYFLIREHHFGPIVKETKETVGVLGGFTSGFCGDDKSFFNCAAVNNSKYSSLAGISLTSMGMLYFMLSMCIILTIIFLQSEYHASHVVLYYWYIAAGSIYAVILFLISVIAIKKICPLCMVTYFAHWLSLAAMSYYLLREGISPLRIKEAFRGLKATAEEAGSFRYFIIIFLSLILSAIAGFGSEPLVVIMRDEYVHERNELAMKQGMEKFEQEKAAVIDVKSRHVMGIKNAPVSIVEFSDFMCPHCAITAEILREVLVDNPKSANVIFMNYPLDISCNPNMKRQLHEGSCLLARGALCAARQGKFEPFYNSSFRLKDRNPTNEIVSQIGLHAGMDMSRFQSCLASSEVKRELDRDISTAKGLGVNSTPQLFINGKKLSGPISREMINRIIKKEQVKVQ